MSESACKCEPKIFLNCGSSSALISDFLTKQEISNLVKVEIEEGERYKTLFFSSLGINILFAAVLIFLFVKYGLPCVKKCCRSAPSSEKKKPIRPERLPSYV